MQLKKWETHIQATRKQETKEASQELEKLQKVRVARSRKFESLFSQKTVNRVNLEDMPDLDYEEYRLGPSTMMSHRNREHARKLIRQKGIV